MKRIFTVVLAALMFTLATVPAIQAEETTGSAELYETGSTVEYFEDGSYTVTTVRESPTARSKSYVKVGLRGYGTGRKGENPCFLTSENRKNGFCTGILSGRRRGIPSAICQVPVQRKPVSDEPVLPVLWAHRRGGGG